MTIDSFITQAPPHAARVADAAVKLGQYVGLLPGTVERLAIAGALHDIGKYGLPRDLLVKTSSLEASEWDVLQTHADRAAEMLDGQVHSFIVSGIYHMRERWDGSGYPKGLAGSEIPLISRVLSVTDGYEAMIHERPYRPAFTPLQACAEIKKKAGIQFDPYLADRMIELVADRRIAA